MKFIAAVLILICMSGGPAVADQDDQRLLLLFEELLTTDNRDTAKTIEQNIWQIWLSSGNEAIDLLMYQGIHQMARGGFKQAAFVFTSIIEINPNFAEVWNKRATVRFLAGDLEGSIEDVRRTLELEPRHFGALAGLGQIFERKNALKLALLAFEKALEVNPHMPFLPDKIRRLRIEVAGKKI